MLDLKIENGTVVIPGVGLANCGIGISDGKVAMLSTESDLPDAKRVIDAAGKHVLPGAIDPHVHLGVAGRSFADACRTETRSALAGGVTTIGCFVGADTSYFGMVGGLIDQVEANSSTDMILHLRVENQQQLEEIPEYISRFGINSFKVYMSGVPNVISSVSDAFILDVFKKVAELPQPAVVCLHAENASMVDAALERVLKTKPNGTLADWSESHPNEAEEEAVIRASFMASTTGVRLYFVHISAKGSINRLRQIRHENRNVYVETTSPYLSVSNDDPVGFLAKMVPPVRSREDVEALWLGVRDGIIDSFGTDDTARKREMKQVEKGLAGSSTGYPAVGTHLVALLHEGCCKRGIPLLDIVEKASANPAKIFGIYPQKGTIAVGSDADLVLVDLDKEQKVDPSRLHSFADFSILEGRTLKGWPVMTVKGGVVAVENGEILVDPGFGHYLRREAKR